MKKLILVVVLTLLCLGYVYVDVVTQYPSKVSGSDIGDLHNVEADDPDTNDILMFDGTDWVNSDTINPGIIDWDTLGAYPDTFNNQTVRGAWEFTDTLKSTIITVDDSVTIDGNTIFTSRLRSSFYVRTPEIHINTGSDTAKIILTADVIAMTVDTVLVNGHLYVGGGKHIGGWDATTADTFDIWDDGDTTRFESDNPIKVGNASLIVETDGDVTVPKLFQVDGDLTVRDSIWITADTNYTSVDTNTAAHDDTVCMGCGLWYYGLGEGASVLIQTNTGGWTRDSIKEFSEELPVCGGSAWEDGGDFDWDDGSAPAGDDTLFVLLKDFMGSLYDSCAGWWYDGMWLAAVCGVGESESTWVSIEGEKCITVYMYIRQLISSEEFDISGQVDTYEGNFDGYPGCE